ncbi:MAG: ribosomal protein S12 methylthiotransferase [Phycisphaerales bacterium]|jgi:ribosomal protein S12 methylthiotransferase
MGNATTPPETTSTAPGTDGGAEINTVSFVSLGCPKNLVDSEAMLGLLAADGIAPVSATAEPDSEHDDLSLAGSEQDASATSGRITPADAVVINTCGFLEASKQESLGVIQEALEAKKRGEIKRVVVAGCLVQRHRAKMFEWAPGIDAMVGVFDRDKIIEAVRGPMAKRTTLDEASDNPTYWISTNAMAKAKSEGMETEGKTVQGSDGKGLGYFEKDNARLRLTPRHYAYLRISEGCNQNCTFCTIPSIRGKMRSKGPDQIVEEARELMRDGAFETLLIGQDTTSYGDDIGLGLGQTADKSTFAAGLPSLLKKLSDASKEEMGNAWLRLMYAYPTTFTDSTIDAFAELVTNGNLLPYLDIPLQHASDNILAAMRRNVTRAQQAELCHKLRDRVPGMAIRTTFITGFPGETEADHQQLLEFIEEIEFDAVGCFQYSMEEGTVAGRQELDPALAVDSETKQRRHDELLALQQSIAFDQAEFVAEQFDPTDPGGTGQKFDILIDNVSGKELEGEGAVKGAVGGKLYQGRGYFQAPQIDAVTYVQSKAPLSPGELVRCTIVACDGYDLIARPETELTSGFSLPIL